MPLLEEGCHLFIKLGVVGGSSCSFYLHLNVYVLVIYIKKKFVLIYVLIYNYAISWSQQNCQMPVPREKDLGSVPAILSWWTLDNSYKIPSPCLYLKNEKQILKNSTLSLGENKEASLWSPSFLFWGKFSSESQVLGKKV